MERLSLKRFSAVGLGTPKDVLGLLFLGARGYKECKSGGPGTMVR
jgi:hypothetical protein